MSADAGIFNASGFAYVEKGEPNKTATQDKPEYRKVEYKPLDAHPHATKIFMVICDEGWRESIVCNGMYEWSADWMVGQLQGKPFPRPWERAVA